MFTKSIVWPLFVLISCVYAWIIIPGIMCPTVRYTRVMQCFDDVTLFITWLTTWLTTWYSTHCFLGLCGCGYRCCGPRTVVWEQFSLPRSCGSRLCRCSRICCGSDSHPEILHVRERERTVILDTGSWGMQMECAQKLPTLEMTAGMTVTRLLNMTWQFRFD